MSPSDTTVRLTTTQVARRLGVSPETVRRAVNSGAIPATLTPGGHRRITLADAEAALAVAAVPRPRVSAATAAAIDAAVSRLAIETWAPLRDHERDLVSRNLTAGPAADEPAPRERDRRAS